MSATPITVTLRRLLGPGEPEVTCEVCFAQLDRFVDAQVLVQDADADAAVPGMRAHLAGCPACSDEHESLTSLVTSE